LAWLEACSVPASLLLSRLSPTAPSGSRLRVLGKAYSGRLSVAQLELVGLLRLRLQADASTLLVLFHARGVLEGSCGGRPVQPKPGGLVGSLFPHERLDLACFTPATQLFGLCLPLPLLQLAVELYNKPPLSPMLIAQVLQGFELALVPILEAFVRNPSGGVMSPQHQLGLQQLEVAVTSTLVRLIPDAESAAQPLAPPPVPAAASGDLCARAEEVMRQHFQSQLDLATLAKACQCSKRTLQLAFRAQHNCTPMQHLRNLRLACMQEQLKLDTSVKEACRAAGLPPTGRTSLQYLEHFGESPSATARNARSAISEPG
jgi:AraC-like DNA-binding protein